MPCGSFGMHNNFVRCNGRTMVKREKRMQISVKPKSETFTFKLRHFRNNVNGLGDNYCL